MNIFGNSSSIVKKEISLEYKYVKNDDNLNLPLIVYFHSAGDIGLSVEQASFDNFDLLIPDKYKSKFNILFPLIKTSTTTDDIYHTVKRFSQNDIKVFGISYSFGGRYLWQTAFDFPKLFSAIVPIASYSNYLRSDRIRELPTWACHGDLDTVVPCIESIKAINTLKNLGNKNAFLTILPDYNHNINNLVFRSKFIYKWFLKYI